MHHFFLDNSREALIMQSSLIKVEMVFLYQFAFKMMSGRQGAGGGGVGKQRVEVPARQRTPAAFECELESME